MAPDRVDHEDGSDVAERELHLLLAAAGLELFPSEIRIEVESMLAAGQSLEPTTRLSFVDAARRATTFIARSRSPLEIVLFNRRRQFAVSSDQLAEQTHLNRELILAVERGDQPIDSAVPDDIAAWAAALQLTRAEVDAGLRRSLGVPSAVGAYGEDQEIGLGPEQERFVTDVLQALENLERARGD